MLKIKIYKTINIMKKHLFTKSSLFLILFLCFDKSLISQSGAALNFDGYDDRIEVQGLNLTGAFTIEVWVNPAEKEDFSTLISNKYGGYEMPGFTFAINNYASANGKLVLETQLSSTISSTSVTWGIWQHVAVTYDGTSQVKMYINGNAIGTDLDQISLAASFLPTVVGDLSVYNGSGNYSGNMDELRIWNYARCANAIQSQMNCELTGNESGLIAYYNFNNGIAGADNSGITLLVDQAGQDNNGTLNYFTSQGLSSNWLSPGAVQTGTFCNTSNAGTDSDCDGIYNECDFCPGGNDLVDANSDGKPDCKFPPSHQEELPSAWKCGNDKVLICHKGATRCVSFVSLADHLRHGDFIGPCGNASCSTGIISNSFPYKKPILHANGLEITTYPNPTVNEFILQIISDVANPVSITINDIHGKTIYQMKGLPGQLFRFGNELASGIYFMKVVQGNESVNSKLIKNQ